MIPNTPAEWERLLAIASPAERAEIEAILAADLRDMPWRPQVGRQAECAESAAFVTGYGGAAGGGKTDLIAGLALTRHRRSVIFRREKIQTEGVIQRLAELLGSTAGHNGQKGVWRLPGGNMVEFGGLDAPDDHRKWQGRPHDLKAYDEVTEMREAQVRFTMGWARSADPAQRCRVLMTFNPPTTAEGRWVIDYFAPWLDPNHPRPAEPGELRWFTTLGGRDVEAPGPEPFVLFRGEPLTDFDPAEFPPEKVIVPVSRTFIPSRVTDNYFYVKSGYLNTLQALPEPLRTQMLQGDFAAGVADDPWGVIPASWVDAAMARWRAGPDTPPGPMDSIGADIAAGGRDDMVIARRHGAWFDAPIIIPGREIPQERAGPEAAARVIMARRDRAVVHADVVGWGLACVNFLSANDVQVVPVNFARASRERTTDGRLTFANLRAETLWRLRETLDPTASTPAALPPHPQLRADLTSYRWELRPTGIFIEPKEAQKARLGRSPDFGDAYAMANMATLKTEVWEGLRAAAKGGDRYAELE